MLVETVELVRLLRPRAALICNIPGLDDAPHRHVVRRTIGSLTKDGYCAADFTSLNAADFGVPQIRHRPFWYVHRTGTCIRWPERTHCDPDEIHPTLPGITPLRPWMTCWEALRHLPEEEVGRYVKLRKRAQNSLQHGSVKGRPARTVGTSNLSDGNVLLVNDKHPVNELDAPSRCITTKGDGRGAQGSTTLSLAQSDDLRSKRDPSTRGPQSGRTGDPMRPSATIDTKVSRVGAGEAHVLRVWPRARPSTTVFTSDRILPPGHHPEAGSIMSQGDAVVLSEKAGAILQGFPEGWFFAGSSKRARWEQIGQAVPIAVAEAVARCVLAQLRGL